MPRRVFEEVVLPHLDAAFNYARWLTKSDADAEDVAHVGVLHDIFCVSIARWLTKSDADAEDVVQDAYVRALRFFSSLRSDDARSWLLTIVRNTWYGRFSRTRRA